MAVTDTFNGQSGTPSRSTTVPVIENSRLVDLSLDFTPHSNPDTCNLGYAEPYFAPPKTAKPDDTDADASKPPDPGESGTWEGYRQQYRLQVITDEPRIYEATDPLPPQLTPHSAMRLEGLNGQARWSRQGVERFLRGDPPRSDLPQVLHDEISARVKFAKDIETWLLVCFTIYTYQFMLFKRAIFIRFASLSPGSGKSTALYVEEQLAFNAELMSGATMAAVKRLASLARGTLILDEAERLSKPRDELVGVVNARAEQGSRYRQVERRPDGVYIECLDLFGPTVFASLTAPVNSIASRTITFTMAPLAKGDNFSPAPLDDAALWCSLRDELYLWLRQHWRDVRHTYLNDPEVRVGSNRQTDLWAPLLSVARQFQDPGVFQALRQYALDVIAQGGTTDQVDDAIAIALRTLFEPKEGRDAYRKDVKAVRCLAQKLVAEDVRSAVRSARIKEVAKALGADIRRGGSTGCDQVVVTDLIGFSAALNRHFPPHPDLPSGVAERRLGEVDGDLMA